MTIQITTIDDIKTAVQNSGFNELFDSEEFDEFVKFCWAQMDGMDLDLAEMYGRFVIE